MRFGLGVLDQRAPSQDPRQFYSELLESVRLARDGGFDYLLLGQTYLANPNPVVHPFPLAARLAAEAGPMTLVLATLLPLQHPVELAEQVSTLDVMWSGRLVLAVALGYRDAEFRAFNVPKQERLPRFLEALGLLKAMWTRERVTHHGRYFHVEDVPPASPPLQQPHPPIWLAGNADAAVRRAARLADGWLISRRATLPTIGRQVGLYRQALSDLGKTGALAISREGFVARDSQEALNRARPYLGGKYETVAAWGQSRDLPAADNLDVPFEELARGRFVMGSPQECIEEIAQYAELGIEAVMVRFQWPGMPYRDAAEAIRLFAEQVMPRFKGEGQEPR